MGKDKGTYVEGARNLISALLLRFPLTGCEKRSPRAELKPEICQIVSNPLIYKYPRIIIHDLSGKLRSDLFERIISSSILSNIIGLHKWCLIQELRA